MALSAIADGTYYPASSEYPQPLYKLTHCIGCGAPISGTTNYAASCKYPDIIILMPCCNAMCLHEYSTLSDEARLLLDEVMHEEALGAQAKYLAKKD